MMQVLPTNKSRGDLHSTKKVPHRHKKLWNILEPLILSNTDLISTVSIVQLLSKLTSLLYIIIFYTYLCISMYFMLMMLHSHIFVLR